MGEPAIQLDSVTAKYGASVAINNLSLTVEEGELLGVLGPSGSGKTTLLSLIAGSRFPDSGVIRFEGRDVTFLPPHKRRVGMVFQGYALFPNRTVEENVAFPLEVRKEARDRKWRLVGEALELVGLTAQAGQYPSQISGGQAQRAALARAIVFKPAILLMDEPLGALDRALRKTLQHEIRALQQRLRIPMVYVTHDQEEAMSLSDRMIIVRDGEVYAEGSPRALYEYPQTRWSAEFLGDANCLAIQGLSRPGWARLVDGREVPVSSKDNFDQPARILIRPENVKVSRQQIAGGTYLKGKVKWIEYLGSIQRIRFGCEQCEVLAQLSGGIESFVLGDEVYLGWDSRDAKLIRDG